jgi:hypothetical protein
MVDVNTQNKTISVNVSSSGVSSNVNASGDTTLYYSNKAREWATSNRMVDGVDYSSKYYASKANENALNAQSFAQSAQDSYNNFQQSVDGALSNIDSSVQSAVDEINNTKTTILNDIEFVADGEKQEIEDLIDSGKEELKEAIGDVKVLTTLKIGQIGIAPLGIDETLNLERYLNGQIIIQDQFKAFTKFLKKRVTLYPSIACLEDEWQTTVTMSAFSQCGKFVIDDIAGTIRLPKVVNIQGLTDLSKLGEIVEAGLPTHTHTRGSMEIFGWHNQGTGAWQTTGSAGGAFAVKGANGSIGSSGNAITKYDVDFYASRNWTGSTSTGNYSKSLATTNTVQQEQIQYPYFIQVATGVETEDNIVNEIELNNPFFFGMSQYFDIQPNNISWLKSNGQWNSKAIYTDYYDWILTNVNNGVEGFIGNTMYMWGSASGGYMCQTLTPKVGSPIWEHYSKTKVGYVTKVYDTGELDFTDNKNNVSYTKIGRYSPSDESSNAYITDYDVVINTTDETFRLPLLDGSESLISDRYENLTLKASGTPYTAPANGWYYLKGTSSATSGTYSCYTVFYNSTDSWEKPVIRESTTSPTAGLTLYAYVTKGQVVTISYSNLAKTDNFEFIYAQGNGSLYYYVGETVQNANLINAGRIEEKVASLIPDNSSLISGYGMPSRYADITLGASGTKYTAPANGYYNLAYNCGSDCYVSLFTNELECSAWQDGNWSALFLPVKKGAVMTLNYRNLTKRHFRFIYAQGEV